MLSKLFVRLRFLLVCASALLATTCFAQNTINVGPGRTYATIQSGIDAAGIGDTVLVAPGTYSEHIDFKGKAITVTSAAGPTTTVIDGGNTDRAVTFKSGETRSAVLSGFTIQHGGVFSDLNYSFSKNAAIYVYMGQPTIRDNVLTQNACWGIYSQGSAPLIQKNNISATLDHSNCSFGGGAAIYLSGNLGYGTSPHDGSSPLVIGNTLESNVESGTDDAGGNGGAGIAVWGGSPVIMNNIIRNNSSPGGTGGAINVETGTGVAIVQNLIYNNSAACGGGALALYTFPDSDTGIGALVANNTIIDNVDPSGGGFSNCALLSQFYPNPNTYGDSTGPVPLPAEFYINNIVSGSTSYPAIDCGDGLFGGPSESRQPTFQNDILFNAGGPFFGNHCVDVSTRDNNIAKDPLLVNPSGGNLQLTSASPAIDAGQNNVLTLFHNLTGLTLSTDIAGNPRMQGVHGQDCTIDIGAYEYTGSDACGTSETVTSSANPSGYNQSVTFTAALADKSGTPTGSVQFSDGPTVLATSAVSSSGSATYTTSTLAVGSHNITATYQPTGIFTAASASLTQVVNGLGTTSSLACNTTGVPVGSATPITVNVTSANGTPTGTVVLSDSGSAIGTQTLTNGSATFSYTPPTAGTHTLSATFQPTGVFAASSAACTQTVTALPSVSILSVAPTATIFGSAVTLIMTVSPANPPGLGAPMGPVNFFIGSKTIGNGTLTNSVATLTTTSLPTGTDELSCSYPGSGTYASSTCNVVPVTITGAASTTTLKATPNPAYLGQTVTLTATVAPVGTATGSISFYDGASLLGSANLASGSANLPISTLGAGTHALTATFAPANGNLLPSTSATSNETILPSGFTLSLSPATVTVVSGYSATTVATVTPTGAFSGPLTFTWGALPPYSTASFTPSTATLRAGGKAIATFALVTHPAFTALTQSQTPVLTVFALLLPLGLARRRKAVRLLVLVVFVTTITGCGSLYYVLDHTPSGTYTIPITATDGNGVSQSATFTVVVTP